MLVLTRKVDESVTIGDEICVRILEIKGNQVRLGIQAPKQTPVNRTEIYESILRENLEASRSPHDLEDLTDLSHRSDRTMQEG